MFQIVPAFAVPFAEAHHTGAATLNEELRTLILAREAEGARWRNPSPSMRISRELYESDFNFFAWPETCGAVDLLSDGLFSNIVYMKGAFFWKEVAAA